MRSQCYQEDLQLIQSSTIQSKQCKGEDKTSRTTSQEYNGSFNLTDPVPKGNISLFEIGQVQHRDAINVELF